MPIKSIEKYIQTSFETLKTPSIIAEEIYEKGFELIGFKNALDNIFMPGCVGNSLIMFKLQFNSNNAIHTGIELYISKYAQIPGNSNELHLEEERPSILFRQVIVNEDHYTNRADNTAFIYMQELFNLPITEISNIEVFKALDLITKERSGN